MIARLSFWENHPFATSTKESISTIHNASGEDATEFCTLSRVVVERAVKATRIQAILHAMNVTDGKTGRRALGKQTKPQDPPKPTKTIVSKFTFLDDFYSTRPTGYPVRDSFPAYILSLILDRKDLDQLAFECVTGGGDDKDTDCCYLDLEVGEAFIIQSYVADTWTKPEAPANKADDLLTSLTWLLHKNHKEIPSGIRQKAIELQAALGAEDVTTLHLLLVHNCREIGININSALSVVGKSAATLIGNPKVNVSARQIGLDTAQRLFNSVTKNIVVEDRVRLKVKNSFPENGDRWRSIATTLDGSQVHELYVKYKDDLYSANLRGFLNMLGRKTSINSRMMESVTHSAADFWVYNNGITFLTKKIQLKAGTLTLTGISVINGAQTTGVIGHATADQAKQIRVPCRIVECNDEKIIQDIITFNNAQNAIKSSDFRSRDPIQMRLAKEFHDLGILYAHRRDGRARLPAGTVIFDSIAAFLAAFHGDFQNASRGRRKIFEDEDLYTKVFRRDITAAHIYLVQTLADAIGVVKSEYKRKEAEKNIQELEKKCFNILRLSPSKYFLLTVIGALDEQIMDSPIADRFAWEVKRPYVKLDRTGMVNRWKGIVEAIILLVAGQTGDDPVETVRSAKVAKELSGKIAPILAAMKMSMNSTMATIRDSCQCV